MVRPSVDNCNYTLLVLTTINNISPIFRPEPYCVRSINVVLNF